ncbi:type II toxin-antitoxin system Phd/YefM family antitoxin [Winogradskya humida]|nr:type II toxin-antitoxin system Phd/YefM family antitoxin [Actinoplanes humidus]
MDYKVPVTQARAAFADLINRAVYASERIVITRHGKPIAALISAADLERLQQLDAAAQPPAEQPPAQQPPAQIVRLGGGVVGGSATTRPLIGQDLGLAAQDRTPPTR